MEPPGHSRSRIPNTCNQIKYGFTYRREDTKHGTIREAFRSLNNGKQQNHSDFVIDALEVTILERTARGGEPAQFLDIRKE